jgi:hypothetical protein
MPKSRRGRFKNEQKLAGQKDFNQQAEGGYQGGQAWRDRRPNQIEQVKVGMRMPGLFGAEVGVGFAWDAFQPASREARLRQGGIQRPCHDKQADNRSPEKRHSG